MTQRLLATVKARWAHFDGWATAHLAGGDPLELPLDRLLNLLYYWLIRGASEEDVQKFDARLWRPPKGQAAPAGSPWSPEAETAAFQSLAAAIKGGPPAHG